MIQNQSIVSVSSQMGSQNSQKLKIVLARAASGHLQHGIPRCLIAEQFLLVVGLLFKFSDLVGQATEFSKGGVRQ